MLHTRNRYKFIITCVIYILLLILPVVSSRASITSITLTPDKGVSAITIAGSGFKANSTITIHWDNVKIPTVPNSVFTDESGVFTCIVSVYNQTSVGGHEVKAVDDAGNAALSIFSVVDVKGLPGEIGPAGSSADGISPGYLAVWLLLAIIISGLMGTFLGRRRQSQPEATPTSQPEATPTSQPEAAPTSQPEAAPTSQPEAAPTIQ